MSTAVIYARVSTEEQVGGYSLGAQVEACKKRAKELGCSEILDFVDEGVSGSLLNRPALTAIRQKLKTGAVDYFICLDPDRLARNISHQLIITEEIEQSGTKLEFINFEWKNSPEGKLFYTLRGAIAEYEKEKIKERSRRGKIAKAKAGKLTHDPQTYGYRYNSDTSQLEIVEEEAKVVEQIYYWFINEFPDGSYANYYSIANKLNQLKIPSPRKLEWNKMTVKRILTNPTYKGVIYLNRFDTQGVKFNKYRPENQKVQRKVRPVEEWIPVIVPKIIHDSIWDIANQKAKQIKRLRPGVSVYDYLLSGILACGNCGGTLGGNTVTRKTGKKNYYYRCKKCTGLKYFQAMQLELIIWKKVESWMANPDLLWKQWDEEDNEQYKSLQFEYEQITKEIERIQKQRVNLLDMCQEGLISTKEVKERMAPLMEREQTLKEYYVAVKKRLDNRIDKAYFDKLAAELSQKIKNCDMLDRKTIIRHLIKEIIVHNDRLIVQVRIPAENLPLIHTINPESQ